MDPQRERVHSSTVLRIASQRQAWILLAGDALLILVSLYGSSLLRFSFFRPMLQEYTGASIVFFFAFLCSFYLLELYEVEGLASGPRTLLRLCGAAALALGGVSAFFFWSVNYRYGRGIFLLAAFLSILLAYLWRRLLVGLSAALVPTIPTLIVGSGSALHQIRAMLDNNPSTFQIIGNVQATPRPSHSAGTGAQHTGDMDTLKRIIASEAVRCLVVTSEAAKLEPDQAAFLTQMKFTGVRIVEAGHFCSQLSGTIPIEFLSDSWLWFADGFDLVQARLARRIKRLSDLVLASVGLVLSSPLMALTALAIRLDSAGPVFYRQKRVGLQKRTFNLIKFRSMRLDAEPDGTARWAAADDDRVTRVGRWLRKLRIDEIPQMINVLRGEMSFIGPRPERPEFVEELGSVVPFYHLRHYVRPGITGWAQVKYHYGSSREDAKRKLEFDLYYIMHASVLLDLRILLQTIRVILFARGSR